MKTFLAVSLGLLFAACVGDVDDAESDAGSGSASPDPLRCIPGKSDGCIGPGACRGGQVCKSDGSGYEPCVCSSDTGGASKAGGTGGLTAGRDASAKDSGAGGGPGAGPSRWGCSPASATSTRCDCEFAPDERLASLGYTEESCPALGCCFGTDAKGDEPGSCRCASAPSWTVDAGTGLEKACVDYATAIRLNFSSFVEKCDFR